MKTKQTINLGGDRFIAIETDGKGGGNMTVLGLREGCPDCGSVDCERTCPAQAEWQDSEREEIKEARLLFNAAVHGVESFLLALACEGVKVEEPKFAKALETVLDAFANRWD